MRPILLNTGLYVKKGETDINAAIEKIATLGVDGLEVGTSFLDHLMEFRLSQNSFSILKNYSFIAMNGPTKFAYRNDRYSRTVLQKLRQVYDLVNAKYAVFHTHTIEDFSIFSENQFVAAIENDRATYGIQAEDMLRILEENPNIKFVLNAAHALSHSDSEVSRLIELLSDRIIAVHLSAREGERDHTPLHLANKTTLEALSPIKKLSCPVIIECWHTYREAIEQEISFVREWLDN